MSGISVEFINPFISAVDKTFATMTNIPVHRSTPTLKVNPSTLYPVSGIIGFSGIVVGTVVMTVSEPLAIKIASTLLMTDLKAVDGDVLDAIGEMTNVIAGNAKARLEHYRLNLSLPNIIFGANTEIRFPESSQPITIPFETEYGPFAVEIGFTSHAVPTR